MKQKIKTLMQRMCALAEAYIQNKQALDSTVYADETATQFVNTAKELIFRYNCSADEGLSSIYANNIRQTAKICGKHLSGADIKRIIKEKGYTLENYTVNDYKDLVDNYQHPRKNRTSEQSKHG